MLARHRQTPPLVGPTTPKMNQASDRNLVKQNKGLKTIYNPSYAKNNQLLVPLSSR